MDIAIVQDSNGRFDVAMDGHDLKAEQGLRTKVIISLFTDARAYDDDDLPDNNNERRGHWAEIYTDAIKGSRLWLLERAKETQDTLDKAKDYTSEALEWFIDEGIAQTVKVKTDWFDKGKIGIYISITKGDGTTWSDSFTYELKVA